MARLVDSKALAITCSAAVIALTIYLGFFYRNRPAVRYDNHIRHAAERYNLDPALIKAVIWQESRFRP